MHSPSATSHPSAGVSRRSVLKVGAGVASLGLVPGALISRVLQQQVRRRRGFGFRQHEHRVELLRRQRQDGLRRGDRRVPER